MDRDDVIMHDGRRRPRFAGEPVSSRPARCKLRCQDLDRDGTSERRVVSFEHDSKATTAEDLRDLIVPKAAK